MSSFFQALSINPFLQIALLVSLAASVNSGIVGSYVTMKRLGFISGSIAHSILGGIGLCVWLRYNYDLAWLKPLYGALAAALVSAFLLGWIHLKHRQREDTIIAALWAIGMAIGIIFISLTPGLSRELMSFMIGDLLWVGKHDLITLLVLGCITLIITLIFQKRFLAICFDENQAYLQGLNVPLLYLLLLVLIAVSTVILVQIVGVVLVITMLTIPPAIANTFSHDLNKIMLLAILINALTALSGIVLAYQLNWPIGATITLLTGLLYLLALLRKSSK